MFLEIVGIRFEFLRSGDNDVWRDKAINISLMLGCFLDRLLQIDDDGGREFPKLFQTFAVTPDRPFRMVSEGFRRFPCQLTMIVKQV